MKKIISKALIAGLLINGASYVSAMEEGAAKTEVTKQEPTPPSETKGQSSSTGREWLGPIKKFVFEDNKKPFAVVGIVAIAYASHKVMVSVCPWYQRLVGADEDEETKTPKLNTRVMNPARPF